MFERALAGHPQSARRGNERPNCAKAAPDGLNDMAIATRRPLETVSRYALTRKEAAAALGVSVDTFERRIQPFIRVIPCGQLILVPPAELERWVKENSRFLV